MSDPVVHETTVKAIIDTQPKPRGDAVVVTPETFNEYVEKMTAKPVAEEETPEAKAAAELEKVEAEKKDRLAKEKKEKKDAKPAGKSDADDVEEIDHPDKEKKGKINERFSEITKARKAAEAKAAAAEAKAESERQAREALEQERNALKAKYEPPKSDELGPEPEVTQFTDTGEYAKALKEWTAEKVRKEDAQARAAEAQKHERERMAKEWGEREVEVRKEIADYDEVVNASNIRVSDQLRDAIFESEVGPKLRYHLATNPDVAEGLAKMTVGRMLKEVGKLEASLMGKPQPPALKVVPKSEISKAPEPISPVKTDGPAVLRLSGHQEVPRNMTYEDWKKARQQGQIK